MLHNVSFYSTITLWCESTSVLSYTTFWGGEQAI